VPNVAGSRFLAQARLSVDAATMPIVDTAFNEAYDWALEATAAPWRTDCLERVARRWRRLLAAAHHPDRAITYARGLQAAADESPGWNVRVNAARIRACRCVDQRRAPSQADWAALHRYVRTDIPAICALTGSGVPAEVVGRLQVTDIASDHATVVDSLTGGTYAVTAPGRPLLQSHVAFRQFADPGATGRLFYAFEPATGATAARRCQRLAERAASDVGFHDALNWGIDINVPDDDFVSWASSTGLSISHTASNPVARVPDAKADAA